MNDIADDDAASVPPEKKQKKAKAKKAEVIADSDLRWMASEERGRRVLIGALRPLFRSSLGADDRTTNYNLGTRKLAQQTWDELLLADPAGLKRVVCELIDQDSK